MPTEVAAEAAVIDADPASAGVTAWFGRSRTGRAVGGLIVDYVGSASSAALSLLVTPLLVSLLGLPMYGYWIAASQILLWLSLLDGGIGVNLMKTISAHKDSEPDRVQRAIASTFWCYAGLGLATLAAGAAIMPFVATWTHLHGAAATEATTTFAIGVVTAAITLVVIPTFYVILQGHQKLALVSATVSGGAILGSLLGLLFVWMGFGVVGLAIGQLIASIVGASVAIWFARRVSRFTLSPRQMDRREMAEMGRFAGYFTMSKLAFLVSNYSDAILIAIFYGTVPVTIFALTQKLSSAAFMFVSRVGPVAIPGLAEMMGKSDVTGLQDITLRMARVLTRIGILVAMMIVALNHRFVSLWTGEATFGGALLTALFAWGIFRDTIIRNLSSVLFASGELKGWGLLSAAEAFLKLGIAVTLLPTLGIVAPMIGTAIAELITGVYTPLKLSRLIDLRPRRLFDSGILPSLVRSLPTMIVLAVLAYAVPHEWRWFGIIAIACGGVLANVLAFDTRTISVFLKSRSMAAG